MCRSVFAVVVVLLALATVVDGQVNGGFGDWTAWGGCSVTCLQGTTTRTRLCDNPPPSGGGTNCTGDYSESQNCIIMNYCLPSMTGNQDLNCGSGYFGCATGVTTCINVTMRCDDSSDCEDGSDENPYFAGCEHSFCAGPAPNIESSVLFTSLSTLLTLVYCSMQK